MTDELALIKKTFRYCPDTNVLERWHLRRKEWTIVENTPNCNGYCQVWAVDRNLYYHRIVFALTHGYLPEYIDHIDQDKQNNHPSNLREVSHSENHRNAPMRSDNTSGVTGVYWHKQCKKWTVRITVNQKETYLGLFDNLACAVAVRKAAEAERGFTKNHGRSA